AASPPGAGGPGGADLPRPLYHQGRALQPVSAHPRPRPCGASETFVRHAIARTAEILHRRVETQVRDAAGVHARIRLHLLAELADLVALSKNRTPVRIEREVRLAFGEPMLGLGLLQL